MGADMRSYLVIWGEQCDPEEITRVTGITPTKTWRAGDVRYAKTGRLHTDCGWRLDAPSDIPPAIDAHLDALLDLVAGALVQLKALSSSCEIQINVVVHCREGAPEMNIRPDHIQRLAAIGAGIDIDLYC